MIKRYFFLSVFIFSLLVALPSCKLFKKVGKADTAQQKADKKKIKDRKIREKQHEEKVKEIYGRQTKETRKRMKANRAKSNRINKGLPERQKRTFRFNLFKKPKWWR
jgi:hypothetical protein